MKALASPTAKSHGWALAPREEVLPAWHRRGRPEETNGEQGELKAEASTEEGAGHG